MTRDWREIAWGPRGTPFFRRMYSAWLRFSGYNSEAQNRTNNPGRAYEQSRAWLNKNPRAEAAHSAVKYALKTGRLVRQPCVCGATKVHAHHPDYSRKLDVIWLCRRCHRALHRGDTL